MGAWGPLTGDPKNHEEINADQKRSLATML